jgi:hypothetical protein
MQENLMKQLTLSQSISLNRFLLVLHCLCLVFAVEANIAAQSADKIVKRAAKAMGGEKALRNIKSWQFKGTISNTKDGAGGSYQAAAMQPNLYTCSFDIRGLEAGLGYNGKSGWMRDSRDGLRTLTGALSRDFQAEASWRNNRWFNYKRDKSRITFGGQATINGKSAHAVVLTTPKNVKIKIYFDKTTGLLIREEIPSGETSKIFDYSDFRPVDGILEPHTIDMSIGQQSYQIKLDQIVHNPQLGLAIFDFPKVSNEPLPDISALLKEVGENEDEIDRLLEKYTYTETITKREIDQKGQLLEKETDTYELTFYKGNRIRRLIAKNGKPLSADEEADESKRIEKRIREIEKKEVEKEKKAQKERENAQENGEASDSGRDQRISIADLLRASKLVNPRRERFRGRDVIVFDFEPLPGYKPQKNYEKLFGKMAGAMWIDASDKQVARVEARLVESYKVGGGLLASLREGASFTLEQNRVNNEIWLPTWADINLGVKVFLVKGFNFNQTIAYGNYKRFNVEAEKEKLKDPPQSEKTAKP